jgi:hypothetical protein
MIDSKKKAIKPETEANVTQNRSQEATFLQERHFSVVASSLRAPPES